ncbi:hypothetical protein SNE40_023365 [Patella caerulea]|uniref:Uncharacterized protein n=1 Tax=Patella caerulea TaxID=87958 RepID=A0AAN8GC01_PATCE
MMTMYLTMPGGYCDPKSFGSPMSNMLGGTGLLGSMLGGTGGLNSMQGGTGGLSSMLGGTGGLSSMLGGAGGLSSMLGLGSMLGGAGGLGSMLGGAGGLGVSGGATTLALFGEVQDGIQGIMQMMYLTNGDSQQMNRLITCRQLITGHSII